MAATQHLTALGYSRVSTEDQARSGLGIEAQQAKLDAWATLNDATLTQHSENGVSGKLAPHQRPVLGALLQRLADPTDAANALVVAKLDRLGRSTIDVLQLAAQAEAAGWHLVMLDLGIDTTTSGGRLVLRLMASLAEWERDVIAERTAAALTAKRQQGCRLGAPTQQSAAGAVAAQVRSTGASWQVVAETLDLRGYKRTNGGAHTRHSARAAAHSHHLDQQAAAAKAALIA